MNIKEKNLECQMERYGNMLFRLGIILLNNQQDAEDAVQETFLRYLQKSPVFQDPDHEKAWFLKVVSNICRDMRRFQIRHPTCDIDDLEAYPGTDEQKNVIQEVLELPQKYKIPICLHYIEGYSVKEIAGFTHCSENAVKKQLQRGREALRLKYGELD